MFDDSEISFSDCDRFQVVSPIGSGKYSLVFLGKYDQDKSCAIKTLKNIPYSKIQREIGILNHVSNVPNAIQLLAVVKDPLTSTISIVTEYQQSETARSMFPKLTLSEIRVLIWHLLVSLDACARKGVMHRDVKPGNILISGDRQSLRLIDWGLADMYFSKRAYTVRVSTLRYKAPELLLNYQYYDYGVDVWGAGCVLAEMLVKFPFFEGRDIDEMIAQEAAVCGAGEMMRYVEKYGLDLPYGAYQRFPQNQGPGWYRIVDGMKQAKIDDEAIDLMKKLLTIDHAERITAAEALDHPFFNQIRSEMRNRA
jgi:casein kinase II subunit alpha